MGQGSDGLGSEVRGQKVVQATDAGDPGSTDLLEVRVRIHSIGVEMPQSGIERRAASGAEGPADIQLPTIADVENLTERDT